MKNHTRNRCRHTIRLMCVGHGLLASSVARADVLDPEIEITVPQVNKGVCGSWVNFRSDYLDSLRWLEHTGIGSASQSQRITVLHKISVEVQRRVDGGLWATLVIFDDKGVHQQIAQHPAGTECSFAVADAADLSAHLVLGRKRESPRIETDYEVSLEASGGVARCNDPYLFRWFFERARVERRFAPRHPRLIALDIQGDLTLGVRTNVTIWPAHDPEANLQRDLPGVVGFESDTRGPTECTNVLRAAARDIINKKLPGSSEPLANVASIREAEASPPLFIAVGQVATLMLPLTSQKIPAFGVNFLLQYTVMKNLDLNIFMATFQQQYIHMQRADARLTVLVPNLQSYGATLCTRPIKLDRQLGFCAGAQVNEWVARGLGLKYPKQGTDVFASAAWKAFYEHPVGENLRMQFFLGGNAMFEPLQVKTDGYIWSGPHADITGGLVLMVAPPFK